MEKPGGSTVGKENEESGMSLVAKLDPLESLGVETSGMSCAVMQQPSAMEESQMDLQAEEVFPDSDNSETNIRRQRKNKKMADPLKQLIKSEFQDLLDYLMGETPNSEHGEVKGSIYAPSNSGAQAFKEALRYSKYFQIEGVGCEWSIFPRKVASEFLDYWKLKHDDGGYGPKYTAYPVHLYWIPKEDIDKIHFETPRDIKINELEEKHVRTLNYYWGRHYEGSEELIAQIVKTNVTAGAFSYSGNLVGWAFQTHYGAISIPFTLPKYRKRGVGRSVLLSLAQSLAKMDINPHIFVYKDDHSLKEFLKNSGFIFVNEMHYLYVDPRQDNPIFIPTATKMSSSVRSVFK